MSRFWSRSVGQWWKDWWKQTKGQLVWEGELYCRQYSLPPQWPQGPSSFASYGSLTQGLVSNCRVLKHQHSFSRLSQKLPWAKGRRSQLCPPHSSTWQAVLLWLISPLPWMWVSSFIKFRHCPRPQVFNLCSRGKRSMSYDPSQNFQFCVIHTSL